MPLRTELLVVLPCYATKSRHPGPAASFYQGGLFRARWRWAVSAFPRESLRILSARYGLVHPDTVLEPYNQVFREDAVIAAGSGLILMPTSGRGVYCRVLERSGYRVSVMFQARTGPGVQLQVLKQRHGQPWPWVSRTANEHKYLEPVPPFLR